MNLNQLREKSKDLPGSISLPKGRTRWQFRYWANDKQQKRTFATEEEAIEAQIQHQADTITNGLGGQLTATQVRTAVIMFEMIGERDALEVVRHGLSGAVLNAGNSVAEAVVLYLADFNKRIDQGTASPQTIRTKRPHLNAFVSSFGQVKLGEVTEASVKSYLASGPWAPVTQDGHRRSIASLYSWAVQESLVSADLNPMSNIKSFELPDTEVEYLNASQLEKLLRWLEENDPGIVAFVALGAFAGIRTSETARLIACDAHEDLIRREKKQIFLPKHTVKAHRKARRARLLENLPDALWKWLDAYPSLSAKNYTERILNAKRACNTPNINSMFRHSYITNAVAMFESIDRVMLHSGHIESATLINHYKGVASKEEGEAYFAIEPCDKPKSIERRASQPKLDLGKARSIRHRVADGETKVALAEAYGVSETLIRQVVKGEKWAE